VVTLSEALPLRLPAAPGIPTALRLRESHVGESGLVNWPHRGVTPALVGEPCVRSGMIAPPTPGG